MNKYSAENTKQAYGGSIRQFALLEYESAHGKVEDELESVGGDHSRGEVRISQRQDKS